MAFSPDTYASKSVLASGNWVKVSVESTGIHFIPLADLRDMGFHDLAKVGVYGYGGRRLPDVLDAKSFIDDLPRVQSVMTSAGIYFYAVGPYERDEDLNGLVIMKANPYSRAGYYFLSDCDALPLRDIPESGIPESFKVLLKELQSLGLDVRVLRDDNTEVEIMESSEYGDVDIRSILESDSRRYRNEEDESLGSYGFSKQEFEGDELVDVEEDSTEEEDADVDTLDLDEEIDFE